MYTHVLQPLTTGGGPRICGQITISNLNVPSRDAATRRLGVSSVMTFGPLVWPPEI